jgi:ABC-2 type transport system permease protein
MNYFRMLGKELKELARSYKLLFIPVVYAVLGLGQPLAYKLLPQLMKSGMTNLPPGAEFNIPIPPPGQIVASAISQFTQLGILMLILAAMGTIAGERNSGVAATVLTKPVSRLQYLAAKITSYSVLAALSLLVGMVTTAYYTHFLIGPVNWSDAALGTVLYLPYLLLAVFVTVFFSTFMRSPVAAGGTSAVILIVLNTVPKYLGKFIASVYPGRLAAAALTVLAGEPTAMMRPLVGVTLLIAAFAVASWFVLERQEI